MTPDRPPLAPCSQRGSAAGAIVFAVVAGIVLVAGYAWLQSRRAHEGPSPAPPPAWTGAADKWTSRLGKFLAKGPDAGTWETSFLSTTCQHYIRPHPRRPGFFLIAQVGRDGPRKTQAVSGWLVPRHFFRAPSSLFFSNYQRSEGPIRDTLADGTEAWRVHWAPRANPEGLTERRVWFAVDTGDVLRVEDRSRTGHLIHSVQKLAADTGDWDPEALSEEEIQTCAVAPPDPAADPEQILLEAVDDAPFPVFAPTHVPAGFVLVRSTYSICDAARITEDLQGEIVEGTRGGTPVHLVTQLYSDGMAIISVAIAPREDMDVIEEVSAGMGQDGGEPGTCPGLPAKPQEIKQQDSVVRMRSDVCRVVLRRDDLDSTSVTLIGRNELPLDEYLHMIDSMREIQSLGTGQPEGN